VKLDVGEDTMRKFIGSLAAAALLHAAIAQAQPAAAPAWSTPSNDEIRRILAERIDQQHDGVGIVVGVIDARGRRYVAYGARDKGDTRPLDENTMFEIGSMTKVFTSLVLSEMVQDHEVALDDPVAKYLPPGTKVPERGGRQITLVDLSTHTSGLPRMPNNFHPKDPGNPYVDYTEDQFLAFLASYPLPRDIGAQYEYSNYGASLLGQALCRRAGLGYEELVKRRITQPLGMADTTVTLTPALQARLARGHDAKLAPVANWDLPTFAGAGALRSDAKDILTFLAAELGFKKTPLAAPMAEQLAVRRPTPNPAMGVALAWHTLAAPGRDMVVWHNGGTGGYRTFMGFDPTTRVGVVVLTNAATPTGGDDIGFHILTGAPISPPIQPLAEHHAIAFDPKAFDALVGVYQLAPNATMTISRQGDHGFAQATGQPQAVEIFPEADDNYFMKAAPAVITFQRKPGEAASALVLHLNGATVSAHRVGAP
jgi:CubicO group peptidase (beta-lactamase class C family)